ncbi:MAG: hypothetical protein QXW52_08660 [Candidatus Caldarchaeum sp.]
MTVVTSKGAMLLRGSVYVFSDKDEEWRKLKGHGGMPVFMDETVDVGDEILADFLLKTTDFLLLTNKPQRYGARK